MGNIRIMTDNPSHVDYTFIDYGSFKLNASTSNQIPMDPMYMLTTTIMPVQRIKKEGKK